MDFALGPTAARAGYRLDAFDSVGSTSTEARGRLQAGDSGPLWIVAREQTAGRGRRGRAWSSPRGNLAASLLLEVRVDPPLAATLGFVAGIALHEAIVAAAPGRDAATLRLKWPNDLLAGGGKLAGILVESAAHAGGTLGVVVGIGVNVVAAPEGVPYPAASLLGSGASAETVFAALSDAWAAEFALWNGGTGLAAIRGRWLERAAGLGAPIAVQLGDRTIRGTFETIDADGRLVVRSDNGPVTIAAGEVHFGTAATAAFR